jgi:Fe-S cluster biogenesis protein NfuA
MSYSSDAITEAPEFAKALVARFSRMVRKDGGRIELVGVDESTVRVAYSPGVDPECEDGVCVLPEVELQALMAEVLASERPEFSIRIERLRS